MCKYLCDALLWSLAKERGIYMDLRVRETGDIALRDLYREAG